VVMPHFGVQKGQQRKLLDLRVVLEVVLLCKIGDLPFLFLELAQAVVDGLVIDGTLSSHVGSVA